MTKHLPDKRRYKTWKIYYFHRNTRYDKTKYVTNVIQQKPSEPFKNTKCPFKLTVRRVRILIIYH